ncbi:homospermidine synthase [Streptomyces sp. B4I13]|nr:homospermidine synthase [Streptomyces sp. B4I13]
MGLFTRRSTSGADRHAEKAYKRGDRIYVRTIHAAPGKNDGGLGAAVARIEAAGWKLEQQNEGVKDVSGYRQQYWTCTFRAVPDVPSS